MHVTRHGRERAVERVGVPKHSVDKMAQRALESGISHGETAGSLRRYLDGLYLSQRKSNNIRIYGMHIYLFADLTLITVIMLPNEYKKAVNKIRSKQNG